MRTIIFDTAIQGHHLEYIHHLYDKARMVSDDFFFVVVPEEFLDLKELFKWEKTSNIEFFFLTSEELRNCSSKNYFRSAFYRSKVLKRYVNLLKIDCVFLITLSHFLPFLPFMLPANIKISGIVYRIFVYEWKNLSFFKKVKDLVETFIMVHSIKIVRVFLLNDSSAVCYYNKLYKTNKFYYLSDPVITSLYQPQNIRSKYEIGSDKNIFFHFGALNYRKGTLIILDAIELLSVEELKRMVFIFAGKIDKSISDTFYAKYERIKSKATIIIIDEFCSYEELTDICYSSDYILIPYLNVSFSSGVLGYAASLNKPVIGPGKGVLGKLIKRNHLGYTLFDITPSDLAEQLKTIGNFCPKSKDYVDKSTIKSFSDIIFGEFLLLRK